MIDHESTLDLGVNVKIKKYYRSRRNDKKIWADAVRWFILSDSPPEKDIQWSDNGVASANKFLQKIWNLNQTIINKPKGNGK